LVVNTGNIPIAFQHVRWETLHLSITHLVNWIVQVLKEGNNYRTWNDGEKVMATELNIERRNKNHRKALPDDVCHWRFCFFNSAFP
jgi:hypothetical protein